VQFYRGPIGDEDAGSVILEMRPGRRNRDGWADFSASLGRLTAPLDAYTARILPREAAESGPLALPLIAWQR
jgi:hypothetical protein